MCNITLHYQNGNIEPKRKSYIESTIVSSDAKKKIDYCNSVHENTKSRVFQRVRLVLQPVTTRVTIEKTSPKSIFLFQPEHHSIIDFFEYSNFTYTIIDFELTNDIEFNFGACGCSITPRTKEPLICRYNTKLS